MLKMETEDCATLEELGAMAESLRLLPECVTLSDVTRSRMTQAARSIEVFLSMAAPAVKKIEGALAELSAALAADQLLHDLPTDSDGGH